MLPLEGIRVLDLSIMYAGPGTTMYLGDMGADVIKVEQPTGDDSRLLGSSPYLGRNSRFYMAVNRNKRGVVLDLRQPAGQEVTQRLAMAADVLLHNFRPGVAERLGVDYPTLHALNPRLIYAWLAAFGSRGPYANRPAYDNIIQGYAGVYDARTRRYGDPSGAGTFISDTAAPMLLGFSIGAALLARERTGTGQLLEGSLLGIALASQSSQWVRAIDHAAASAPSDVDIVEDCCPVLRCADGEYVVASIVTDGDWQGLCSAIEQDDLARDSRFMTMEHRARRRRELAALIEPEFERSDQHSWLRRLSAAGVPCVPLVLRNDVRNQPHIQQNGMLATLLHPAVGEVQVFDIPVQLSGTPGSIRRPPPIFGQDTEAVLTEIGYSPAEIARLRAEHVIA